MTDLFITGHAHDRYMERFGGTNSIKSIKRRENTMRKAVAWGVEIKPVEEWRVLLKHKFKNVKYCLYRNIVAVVENGRVVTVYGYDRKKWLPLKKLVGGDV